MGQTVESNEFKSEVDRAIYPNSQKKTTQNFNQHFYLGVRTAPCSLQPYIFHKIHL